MLKAEKKWEIKKSEKTGIYEVIFPNNLKVLCLERFHIPTVTIMTCYRFGAVDSIPGETGIAHFIEHLTFKGTDKFKKGEIDLLTQKYGGYNNAFTSVDYTCYFFNFVKEHWEKALEIESERMWKCKWDTKEFHNEKNVVLEEIASNIDNPIIKLNEEIESVCYSKHPYRYPILGWEEDIRNLELDIVEKYYKNYYSPNNAVLIIVGAVSHKTAIKKAHKWFAKIPSSNYKINPRNYDRENKIIKQCHVKIKDKVEISRFQIVFNTCEVGKKDDYILDLIDIILATGRTSRFFRKLILENKLLQSINTMNDTRRYRGIFLIEGELRNGVEPEKVEKIIKEELERLKNKKIGVYELARAKNIFIADFIFSKETNYGLAENIGMLEMLSHYKTLEETLEVVKEIDAEEIRSTAKKYFDWDKTVIGWSLPEKSSHNLRKTKNNTKKTSLRGAKNYNFDFNINTNLSLSKSSDRNISKILLENGLTVLMAERHNLPTISMQIHSNGGILAEDKPGVSSLLGRMLLEGTKNRSAEKISRDIEFIGGNLYSSPTRIISKGLSKDLPILLEIVSDIARNPLIDKTDFENEKEKAINEILSQQDNPSHIAYVAFSNIIYDSHPYGRTSKERIKDIESIKRKDVLKFHNKYFVPNNCVLSIAGDFDSEKLREHLEKFLGSWRSKNVIFPKIIKLKPQNVSKKKYIKMDRRQVKVYFGHLGIDRGNKDFYKLLVMDNILGYGSGFTDRLSQKIRDELGLVYHISADITSTAGKEPGIFIAKLNTTPKNYYVAMKILKQEINKLQRYGITEEELNNSKSFLKGTFHFTMETNSSISNYLLRMEKFGLGLDYLDKFPQMIDKITQDDILEVARKYLRPKKSTTVVVGCVDKIQNIKYELLYMIHILEDKKRVQ